MALALARVENAEVKQYVLLIPVLLLLGLACAALLNVALRAATRRISQKQARAQVWYSGALLVAAIAWITVSGYLGLLTSSFVLRLMSWETE